MCVPGWLARWLAGWRSLLLDTLGASTGLEGLGMDTAVYPEVFPDVEVAGSPGQGCSTQDRELQES